MTLVAAKCPQCGGAIQLPDEMIRANCMYCGASLVVKEALGQKEDQGPDAKRLIELGETSLLTSRNQEAYNYFTRALETNFALADAWLGKAKASRGLVTLNDTRKDEIVLCCNKYVELSSREGDALVKASELLSTVASGIAYVSFSHFKEYGGTFVGQVGSLIPVTDESETVAWISRLLDAVALHVDAINYSVEAKKGSEQAIDKLLESLMCFVDNCYLVKSIGCHAETTQGRKIQSTHSNVLIKGMNEEHRSTLLGVYDTYQKRLVEVNASASAKYQDLTEIFKQQNKEDASSKKSLGILVFGVVGFLVLFLWVLIQTR